MTLRYRPDIDYLRAIAVLAVVASHWGIRHFAGGYVGVDVFFVISGYLITRMIYTDAVSGDFSFISFYERRIRRILPALYLMVVATWIVSLILLSPNDLVNFSKSIKAVVTFTSNILFRRESGYFDLPSADRPLLHTWSLSVEEQFYLVFPAFIFLLVKWAPGREFIWFSLVALFSLGFSIWEVRFSPTAAFYLAPTRAWEFLLGSILAVGAVACPTGNVAKNVAASVGLALILFSILVYTETTPFPGINAIAPCLGSALFIWAYSGVQERKPSGVGSAVLAFFGRISYSLYLWHWPVLVFARYFTGIDSFTTAQKALMIGGTICISYLSFRYIEQPVRRRAIVVSRSALFASAGIASVLLYICGVAGQVFEGFPQRLDANAAKMAEYADYKFAKIYRLGSCFITPDQKFAELKIDECTPTADGAKNVLVWGDSLAAHYVYGLQQVSAKADISIWQATAGACPPIFDFDDFYNPNCRAFNDGVRSIIESKMPDAVIMSAAWAQYIDHYGYDEVFGALRKTILHLNKLGITIFLFGPSIEYTQSLPTLLSKFAWAGVDRFNSGKYLNHKIFDVDDRMNSEFSHFAGVHFLSILKAVCLADQCPALVGDEVPMQWGINHVTAPGSVFIMSKLFPAMVAPLESRPH
jgi:peptidoglycan/LPS O-acetylase OafA/YrhL